LGKDGSIKKQPLEIDFNGPFVSVLILSRIRRNNAKRDNSEMFHPTNISRDSPRRLNHPKGGFVLILFRVSFASLLVAIVFFSDNSF
jgi:hypothetical protein